ncbi:MAG: hypothetical protein LBD38_02345, partial [Streptococcaceae bacterium]|nr:hypothetical protein [Streptococcaceae bacterium]
MDSYLEKLNLSLQAFHPEANEWMETLSLTLLPISAILLCILFYMNFQELHHQFLEGEGRITVDFFLHMSWKYLLILVFIRYSNQIVDTFVFFHNVIGQGIQETIPTAEMDLSREVEIHPDLTLRENYLIESVRAITFFAIWTSEILVQAMIAFRFIQLYLFKALAPILAASAVHSEWGSVFKIALKRFVSVLIQGILLILLIKLYPILTSIDFNVRNIEGEFLKNLNT